MDLADLITNDHAIFDGVQTVVLKNPAGTLLDSVAYVTAGPVSLKALQMIGGGLVDNSQTIAFSLPASLCAFSPVDSCTITDASGVVWRVLSVDLKTLDKRYTCNCVRDKLELSTPLQITGLAVVGGMLSVTLAWAETSGADDYRIEASLSASFTSPTVATGTLASIVTGTTASKILTLPASGAWYVRVRRSNALGDSPWSDVVSAVASSVVYTLTLDDLSTRFAEYNAVPASIKFTLETEAGTTNPIYLDSSNGSGNAVGSIATASQTATRIHDALEALTGYAGKLEVSGASSEAGDKYDFEITFNESLGAVTLDFGTGSQWHPKIALEEAVVQEGISGDPGSQGQFTATAVGTSGGGFNIPELDNTQNFSWDEDFGFSEVPSYDAFTLIEGGVGSRYAVYQSDTPGNIGALTCSEDSSVGTVVVDEQGTDPSGGQPEIHTITPYPVNPTGGTLKPYSGGPAVEFDASEATILDAVSGSAFTAGTVTGSFNAGAVSFTTATDGDAVNLDPVNVDLTAPEITHSIT